MASVLLDQDMDRWLPNGRGLGTGADEILVIAENVEAKASSTERHDDSVLVVEEAYVVGVTVVRAPDEGENHNVILFALISVHRADVVSPECVEAVEDDIPTENVAKKAPLPAVEGENCNP